MGTNLDIAQGTLDLQTMFEVMWVQAFENPAAVGGFGSITQLVPNSSKKLDISTFGPGPVMREWVGQKLMKQFRYYEHEIEVKNYEKSIAIHANDRRYDPSSAVARKLSAWFGSGGDRDLDKIIHDSIVSNSGTGPTGYDGVTLLNNSHPHMDSGSGYDNLTTDTLTFSSYDAGWQAMTSLRNEEGESMGKVPTLLRVGPSQRKIAFEIANIPLRAIPLNASGVEATSSVVTTAAINNVFQGEVMVEVNLRYVGSYANYWDLIDTSDPNALPMGFMLNRSPELISKDRDEDDNRFHNNEEHHSIELDGAAFAAFFPSIYGGRS